MLDEWQATTKVTVEELEALIEKNPIACGRKWRRSHGQPNVGR